MVVIFCEVIAENVNLIIAWHNSLPMIREYLFDFCVSLPRFVEIGVIDTIPATTLG